MGLFDSIKKTAQDAVNSVTGSQPKPQQPRQQIQQNTSVQPQTTQPQTSQVNTQPKQIESHTEQKQEIQSQVQPTQNTNSQLSFIGKSYSGSGVGPLLKVTKFYEDYLQFGDDKIPYTDLSEITIIHMPSSFTNGTAQVLHKSALKTLTLSFNYDASGFIKGVDYANEKIAEASGNKEGRKFILRGTNGAKVEVYEDYLSIKMTGTGLSGMMGQSNNDAIMMFQDIKDLNTSNGNQISISYTTGESMAQILIPFSPTDSELVNDMINYIKNYTPDEAEIIEETWKLVTGTSREFPLLGKTLTINEDCDTFNTYRSMYMRCAMQYTEQMKKTYTKRVHDFDSFMLFYLPLYKEYLDKIINKTTDILVSAGIWTETSESIMQRHIENNHLAMDDYTAMYNSLTATVQNNKQSMANITSFVPNLVGGGFGLTGAVKGIAQATAFNLIRDGAESALVGGMNISSSQKAELYGRIKQNNLFNRAFLDLWRVFVTLITILNENGKNVWVPTNEDSAKADNIMKNVSNPNFPQEQFPDVMVAVIGMNPYKKSIYELLRNKGADESEVAAISEYFGYTENTPDVIS